MYFFRDEANIAIIVTYVDDVLLASNSDNLIVKIREYFKLHFSLKFTDNPEVFHGLEILKNQ